MRMIIHERIATDPDREDLWMASTSLIFTLKSLIILVKN